MKKDRWTESELVSLPLGENDSFDRKSGALLSDPELLKTLAKALSAFSNSGGGHLIIGVQDGGTIDGVLPIHKGRTSTRDWLEQIIPELVSYPLQDFRIHEVERDTPSSIPPDRVVIVIDIGDSILAPHQDTFTKYYFHRSGGRSEPAPHHYLEMLRGRERYPSKQIAHGWLNFVVSPWLRKLVSERDHFMIASNDRIQYYQTIRRLPKLTPFSPIELQFLSSYEIIQEASLKHDTDLASVQDEIDRLSKLIEGSDALATCYAKAISHDSLREISQMFASRLDSQYTGGYPDMVHGLFGTMSKKEQFSLLAELILNRERDVNTSNTFWPLWNARKSEFMEVLTSSPIREQQEVVDKTIEAQLQTLGELVSLIERTRHDLSFKHGELWEDPTLQNVVLSHESVW